MKRIVSATVVNNSTGLLTIWYSVTSMVHPHNRAERLALAKKKHRVKRPPEEDEEDAVREEVRREIWDRQDD